MTAHGAPVPLGPQVAVLTGPGSDPGAVSALEQDLTASGVTTLDPVSTPGQARAGETVIYVGGPDENPQTAGALAALHVTGAGDLAAQGYVLATGAIGGHPSIVLDGHDADGTFYAVQTLRQLVRTGRRGTVVPGVRVRDWPTMPLRGVIEGFYGPEWSNADRMSMFDFEARNKMNIFVYSPKDDPYLRDSWRDPYPADQLAAIGQLVAHATADHVQFTYAISPGLSVCYSSAADEATLVTKLESMYAIGVRSFSIPFDDVTEGTFNCAADTAMFGSGNGAFAAAQAYLLNEVQDTFIAAHPDIQPLQMVPTEYCTDACGPYGYGQGDAYTAALSADLSPAVIVGWTGTGTVPVTITAGQAASARQVYGHPVLLWDNYPVNDYVTNRLLLGPYTGRAAGLSADLYGITANPMIQEEASKIALFGVAAYSWNDAAYNPQQAWAAGIRQLAGPSVQAQQALAALADLSYSSDLDPAQAPALTAKLSAFWPSWERGGSGAAAQLGAYLKVIASIPQTLPATMGNPAFTDETQTWLTAAGDWGTAASQALKMLTDERAGQVADAVADRVAAETDQAAAPASVLDSAPLDAFITRALAEDGRFLGVAATDSAGPQAITSLPVYLTNTPGNMIDGDASTYFWSSGPPSAGDYVGVDLGRVADISSVAIQAGDTTSPDDYIMNAALQYSADGSSWTTAGTYDSQPDITATFPAGTTARYVRLVATAADSTWVKVHEFDVTAQYSSSGNVTGTPAAASGSSLAAAGDGQLNTVYTAAGPPAAGDALVLTLPQARPLAQVEIIAAGSASVQIKAGERWRRIGALSARGYTQLTASGAAASAIRLAWVPGSPAPTVTDIIPRYAADEALTVSAPAPAGLLPGGTAQITAQLTSTLTRSTSGVLTATAPAGLAVHPVTTRQPVLRGGQADIALTITAAAAGTYPVILTYAGPGLAPVSTTVTVTVVQMLYDFDDATAQGWQAGQNVTGVMPVTTIANSPGSCFSGSCLQATMAAVAPTAEHSIYIAPSQPVDMSSASALSLEFNSWGSVPGVDETDGYQVTVTLTGAGNTTLTKTFATSADAWSSVSLDLAGWPGAAAVSRIEVGMKTADTTYGAWAASFQIDNVALTLM